MAAGSDRCIRPGKSTTSPLQMTEEERDDRARRSAGRAGQDACQPGRAAGDAGRGGRPWLVGGSGVSGVSDLGRIPPREGSPTDVLAQLADLTDGLPFHEM